MQILLTLLLLRAEGVRGQQQQQQQRRPMCERVFSEGAADIISVDYEGDEAGGFNFTNLVVRMPEKGQGMFDCKVRKNTQWVVDELSAYPTEKLSALPGGKFMYLVQ